MWKSRIKLGVRYLLKEKAFSFINVFGLALGLGAAIAIFAYSNYHKSFDAFHSDSDQIFRLFTVDEALGVSSSRVGITTPAAGPTAYRSLPDVKEQVRFFGQGRQLLRVGDVAAYAENFAAVDTNFFSFFDFELKEGSAQSVLRGPDDCVISESLAERLFGSEDPMGQQIEMPGNPNPMIVKGICADSPRNSHLQFDLLSTALAAPGDTNTAQFFASWGTIAAPTYIKLDRPSAIDKVITDLLEISRENNYGDNFSLAAQPFKEAHLYSTEILFDNHNQSKADIGQIQNLTMVAVFLLVIAAFNFMNLSTVKSTKRAREIGMRKVIGASVWELIAQFLFEAVLISLLACALGLFILKGVEGYLGIDVPTGFTTYIFGNSALLLNIIIGTVLVGLLSGIYPALVLSSFPPLDALKGTVKSGVSGKWMRRVLVSLQFAVSIAVIIGMLVVKSQVDFMQEKDMGFDKDGIVNLRLNDPQLFQNAQVLKDQMEGIEGIEGVAFASSLPGMGYGRNSIVPEGYSGDETWIFSVSSGNFDFADVMNFKLLEGRWYDEEHTTDVQQGVVMNQAAMEALGWETAVGKTISVGPGERTVIGVIENFHYVGLRYPIEPLIIFPMRQPGGTLVAKVEGRDAQEVIAEIEAVWREVNPNHPFEYNYFDEQFNQLFTSDQQFASILRSFNGLAILIACLGLLGLTAYTVQSKTKELGMRKVLGAELPHMLKILSREFWWSLLVANLVAIPVAYMYMQEWLSEFVYRVDLGVWPFVAAVLLTAVVAFLTLLVQAIRAMRIDPIVALKYE